MYNRVRKDKDMSETTKRCPECGAAGKVTKNGTRFYKCDSFEVLPDPRFTAGGFHESQQCLRNQVTQLNHAHAILTEKLAQRDGTIAELILDNDRLRGIGKLIARLLRLSEKTARRRLKTILSLRGRVKELEGENRQLTGAEKAEAVIDRLPNKTKDGVVVTPEMLIYRVGGSCAISVMSLLADAFVSDGKIPNWLDYCSTREAAQAAKENEDA